MFVSYKIFEIEFSLIDLPGYPGYVVGDLPGYPGYVVGLWLCTD